MHPLHQHLNHFIAIHNEDFQEILPYFTLQKINKKEVLMEGNTRCQHNYFVLKGCMHMYFMGSNGSPRTVQFAIENWWISDFLAYHHQATTDFYIQAVEDSEILTISYQQQETLLTRFPKLEKYFRHIYQIAYGASLVKFKYLFEYSKEDMYFHFTEQFPEFAQRVPQYLIASFLGLTPEYVSEIRRKKRS
ncbi:Crp/Fnr family transcriptional regulator [Tenacibaculum sp. TC6]|uniref:Crp/Fnr family transcriptional regulator n=1 Tax=Tenacibaculum sp. TC6 TaxID=3423223 RepID=UPI003D366B27